MGLAFDLDIWHMYVQKRKHLCTLKANILPIALEFVPSIGMLSEYLWKIDGLALKSTLALRALCMAITSYHFPHGTDVRQGALISLQEKFYSKVQGLFLEYLFLLWIGDESTVHSIWVPSLY